MKLIRGLPIIAIILLSCSSQKGDSCQFPEMVIDTQKDRLKVGEIYKARISLSDTSLLYLYTDEGVKDRRTHPVFWINDELIESDKDYLIYETKVDTIDSKIFSDGTKYKTYSIKLAFPHPSGYGEVILSARNSYVIEEK